MTDRLKPETTPSRRAGLRDEIVNALGRIKTVPPVAHRREQADHVLAVLYREWPWLRAETEDATPPQTRAEGSETLRQRQERVVRGLFPHTGACAIDELLDELGHVRDDAYRQLLARLQQERARSLRNAPLCTLDEARRVNEGIATGLQIAAAWAVTLFEGHDARMRYLKAEDVDAASSTAGNETTTEQAQAAIARVQHLADLIDAGAPWTANDQNIAARIRDAINPDGHDGGPTVAECRDVDRRWPLQKAGE